MDSDHQDETNKSRGYWDKHLHKKLDVVKIRGLSEYYDYF